MAISCTVVFIGSISNIEWFVRLWDDNCRDRYSPCAAAKAINSMVTGKRRHPNADIVLLCWKRQLSFHSIPRLIP